MTRAQVIIHPSDKEGTPQKVTLTDRRSGNNTIKFGDILICHRDGSNADVEVIHPHSDRPPNKLGRVPPGESRTFNTPTGPVTVEHKPLTPFTGTLVIHIKK